MSVVRSSIPLDDDPSPFRREFTGDSTLLALLFDNYVTGPAVARPWDAATSTGR